MRVFAVRYLKALAVTAVLLVSFSATYILMHHERIFPSPERIVIYGRDGCGITSALLKELGERNIAYSYADVDRLFVSYELAAQLNLTESRAVRLPVVLVGGRTLERPPHELVLRLQADAVGIRNP